MAGPLQDTRERKYQAKFIKYGFTSVIINGDEHNVTCCEVLANESFKVNKLIQHKKNTDIWLIAKEIF
jgi:hypothetical protein